MTVWISVAEAAKRLGVTRLTVYNPEMAALARSRLALVRAGVPEEGPVEHIRNALALLVAHENAHPAIWKFSEELRAAEARLFKALFKLGSAPSCPWPAGRGTNPSHGIAGPKDVPAP